jgi:hypothetical protein
VPLAQDKSAEDRTFLLLTKTNPYYLMKMSSEMSQADHAKWASLVYQKRYKFSDAPTVTDFLEAIKSDGFDEISNRIKEPDLAKSGLTSYQRRVLACTFMVLTCQDRLDGADYFSAMDIVQSLKNEIVNGKRSPATDFEELVDCLIKLLLSALKALLFVSLLSLIPESFLSPVFRSTTVIALICLGVVSFVDLVAYWTIPFYVPYFLLKKGLL